eukprot:m.104053 g.104053  ORF g.104053 m.104053 type:complete len:95 (+) comp15062_c6_seq1:1017-1301(+)
MGKREGEEEEEEEDGEEQEPEEDDGWTVVKRGNKSKAKNAKNKGKKTKSKKKQPTQPTHEELTQPQDDTPDTSVAVEPLQEKLEHVHLESQQEQ